MAYLNMRDRRVEATILYVGALGAGRATNLEHLRAHSSPSASLRRETLDGLGDVLRMDWLAPTPLELRDCTLVVRLIAARGDISSERARALVRAADGVVLVTDLRPDARERNKAMAHLLQEAVRETKKTALPVVVQANKTDAPNALDASAIVEDLDEPWPCIPASAARGEGVLETVERALSEVLARLRSAEATDPGSAAPGLVGGPNGIKSEGNPLLAALRQVLRETVEEHVAQLEARLFERLAEAQADEVSAIGELSRGISVQATSLSAVERLLEKRHEQDRAVAPALEKLASESAASFAEAKQDLGRAEAGLRAAIAELIDARARADRDQLAASFAPLRRSVETFTTEIRGAELTSRLGAVRDGVLALTKEVESLSERSRKLEALMAANGAALNAVLGPQLARVEELVRKGGERAEEAAIRADTSVAELKQRTGELFEELARRAEKKGWFR